MTAIFFDTEFIEDGETIVPLAFAFVTSQGKELYLVMDPSEIDLTKADPWVQKNVLPYLQPNYDSGDVGKRAVAAELITEWVDDVTRNQGQSTAPRFWADHCSYDWVVLCQLFGKMVDLPHGWSMYCNDVQTLKHLAKYGHRLPEPVDAHHAMSDAKNVRERHAILMEHMGLKKGK